MSFLSPIFLFLFFPAVVAGYYFARRELKNIFLLAASLLFYAWGEPRMIFLLLASAAANYVFGLLLERFRKFTQGRLLLLCALIWNFGILYYFKYHIFVLRNVNSLLGTSIAIPEIALPLGISFFTFRAVSYCLDIYWESCAAQKNPVNTGMYIAFFPQVSMGPITEYSMFEKQFGEQRVSADALAAACRRIITGLAKKVILADQLGIMVDAVFEMPDAERTVLAAWLGILGYLFQLYFDFSGYADLAIGIGGVFGFQAPENFNFPYLSKSMVEFWAKWHITLGDWLKKYLYTPVFRSVTGKTLPVLKWKITVQFADYIALLAVWLFAGIWHGAAWHYVVYGLYNCFFIICERVWAQYQKKRRKRLGLKKQPETRLHVVAAHLYFLVVLVFGQLMFRVRGGGAYLPYIKSMFGLGGNAGKDLLSIFLLKENMVLLLIAVIAATPVFDRLKNRLMAENAALAVCVENVCAALFLVASLGYTVTASYNPFLYMNF